LRNRISLNDRVGKARSFRQLTFWRQCDCRHNESLNLAGDRRILRRMGATFRNDRSMFRFIRIALLAVFVQLSNFWAAAPAQERTDFPDEARERYEKGVELRKNGHSDDAIREFDEAIKLGMQAFPRVHLSRAGSNLDLKRYDTAIADYTKFIEQFGLEKSCRL
jgi:hypothetical protein